MVLDDVPLRGGRHRLRTATQWTMNAAVPRAGRLTRWRRRLLATRAARTARALPGRPA